MSTVPGVTAEVETRQESKAGAAGAATRLVVCLGPAYEDAPAEHLYPLLLLLREALGDNLAETLVTYPVSDPQAASWQSEGVTLQPYLPSARLQALSVQTAATYVSLYEVMRAHSAECGLLLGAEAHTLEPAAIRGLVEAVFERSADLALARYAIVANEGLLNAAMLYPLSRAVFGVRVHFPLALDLAISARMADVLATAAQRLTANTQPDALVWPAAEAAVAGYTVAEVDAGRRDLPHPDGSDLSEILSAIAASLFTDIENKASFWQRTRPMPAVLSIPAAPLEAPAPQLVAQDELNELMESFRIGYGNLHELWSLVLPPQTLLGLKRLSQTPSGQFLLPDALWVRIVYDFVLAHRLRTINRGHLLGSLTPLYLAWVASHVLALQNGTASPSPDTLARAFEGDKPYLVSRWRWPDRFNP